jgi:hypothetical protein
MVAGLAAGFAVNANLKELYAGNTVEAGILAVSLFAVANAPALYLIATLIVAAAWSVGKNATLLNTYENP